MDNKEEQQQELEALEAIFAEDYQLLEEATDQRGPRFSLSVSDADLSIDAKLIFTLPSSYPQQVPQLVFHSNTGIPAARREALVAHLKEQANEIVGEPMVFALHSAAKEWLEDHTGNANEENGVGIANHSLDRDNEEQFETRDEEARHAVETIHSKVIGTPVTVDSFIAWREKFMKEFGYRLDGQRDDDVDLSEKLTGREFFEQGENVVDEDNETFWAEQAEVFEE